MAKKLEIKPEFIGVHIFNRKAGRSVLIEEGKEKLYKELGFKIFKENDSNRARKGERVDSNSNGENND